MNTFVAPAASVDIDDVVCSAAISVKRRSAAAECSTGIDTRVRMLEMMCASRNVHCPSTNGNRKPLKKALGLYKDFLSALNRWTFNFFVSWMSSRTRSRRTVRRKVCVMCGFVETKILVAS